VQLLEQDKNIDEHGLSDRILEAARQQYQDKVDRVGARSCMVMNAS